MSTDPETGFFSPLPSWRRFKLGLAVFAAAAACLLLIAEYHVLLYWLALALLLCGFVVAISGYVGIFILRFSHLREAKQKITRSGK